MGGSAVARCMTRVAQACTLPSHKVTASSYRLSRRIFKPGVGRKTPVSATRCAAGGWQSDVLQLSVRCMRCGSKGADLQHPSARSSDIALAFSLPERRNGIASGGGKSGAAAIADSFNGLVCRNPPTHVAKYRDTTAVGVGAQ
jgi:hypothetical protein